MLTKFLVNRVRYQGVVGGEDIAVFMFLHTRIIGQNGVKVDAKAIDEDIGCRRLSDKISNLNRWFCRMCCEIEP
jgi:hypothetical protein